MKIRTATPADAKRISEIYAPYVEGTSISFELTAPDEKEMRSRIENTLKDYPYIVAEDDDGVVRGYAYAGKLRVRAAYIHCAETSIYVDREYRQSGIGRALYEELEKRILRQNVYVLFAGITYTTKENDPYVTDDSIRFHKKLGYTYTGEFPQCGYKFGNWYGVCWYEKNLCERPEIVKPFVPFSEIESE